MSRKHPCWMPEPLFQCREAAAHSELLALTVRLIQLGILYSWSLFGQYPHIMNRGEVWNVDWSVNWEPPLGAATLIQPGPRVDNWKFSFTSPSSLFVKTSFHEFVDIWQLYWFHIFFSWHYSGKQLGLKWKWIATKWTNHSCYDLCHCSG